MPDEVKVEQWMMDAAERIKVRHIDVTPNDELLRDVADIIARHATATVAGAKELAEGIQLAAKSIRLFNVEHYSVLVEVAEALDIIADAVAALPTVDVAAVLAVADYIRKIPLNSITSLALAAWENRLRAALNGKQ